MSSQVANDMQYLANMAQRFKTHDGAVRLGARIHSARKTAGFTLAYVSQQTGVDAGQISKMERGQMATLSSNVQKICKMLKVVASTGDLPLTRAGQMLDELIAEVPGSEQAIVELVAAIEEVVLRATGSRRSGRS